MKEKLLCNLVQMHAGVNASRINEVPILTIEDMEDSLQKWRPVKKCIISLINSKASPLGEDGELKSFTSNFVECEFNLKEFDPWYFCYIFNEDENIRSQIQKLYQGTTIAVKKLTLQNLGQLVIPIPTMDYQHKAGKLYYEANKLRNLMKKQADNYYTATMKIISELEKGE